MEMNHNNRKMVALKNIVADTKFNTRKELGDINALKTSIQELGITTPIGVKEVTEGKYSLVFGFRRVSAARSLGLTEIPCQIYPPETEDRDLIVLNIQENVARKALNMMEEAHGAQRLIDEGFTKAKICSILTWSMAYCTRRLNLLDTSPTVQQALVNDQVTEQQARLIDKIEDPEVQKELIEQASGLTVAGMRKMVNEKLRIDDKKPEVEHKEEKEEEFTPASEESQEEAAEIVDKTKGIRELLNSVVLKSCTATGEDISKSVAMVASIDFAVLSSSDLYARDSLIVIIAKALGVDEEMIYATDEEIELSDSFALD